MSNAMQSLRPQLDRARHAWRASPVPAFLRSYPELLEGK